MSPGPLKFCSKSLMTKSYGNYMSTELQIQLGTSQECLVTKVFDKHELCIPHYL